MKKVLLLAAVACMAMTASAQLQAQRAQQVLHKSTATTTATAAKKVAMKADLKENQYIVGLYNTDEFDEYGVGWGSAITMEVGSDVPNFYYSDMKDLKVDGVRFALTEPARINKVALYGVNSDGTLSQPLATLNIDKTCPTGWNYFEFDEPYVVDLSYDELMPTYELSMTASQYPIACYSGEADYYSFLAYGNLSSSGTNWYNLGTDYGTPAIQMVCSAAAPEGLNVSVSGFGTSTVAVEQEFKPVVNLLSHSSDAITSVGYTIQLGDEEFSGTSNVNIAAGYNQRGSFAPSLKAPAKAGNYPVTVSLTSVNGEDITPVTLKSEQAVVTRLVPRMSVVEEYTGTGCGYCPMGWLGMEYVKEHMSDIAYVIAIHHYNSTDPMYVASYHDPKFKGAPQCAINRMTLDVSPYPSQMQKYLPQFSAIVPEVDIMDLKAVYTDANQNKVEASANTEFLTDLPGSELVFVLTADELSGTTSAWKQSNYLYNAPYTQYGQEFADFCRGGKMAQSKVALTFNDVMIGSSWPSATKANTVPKFTNTEAGNSEASTCTLSLPTSTVLKNAINKDKVYVTAFVLCADGHIANASRTKVEFPEGIDTVLAPATVDAPAYDLSGRAVQQNAKGITIQNGKKVIR